ncbi:MAG: SseB family protein [Blautia sp.]|nr:SseB family protein [Blautia sp.]
MGISKQEAIRKLQTKESYFVAYSQYTKMPYVVCDEESFNDQVHVFATEELVKEYGKKLLEEKILLMGMKYEKKVFPNLYGLLFSLGVNSVVWHENDETMEVELSDFVRQPDFSKMEEAKRPLFNPTLQLSAMYFLQELRRPLKKEERTVNLRELEEELLGNLRRSEFLIAVDGDPQNPKNLNVPYMKTKDNQILQPVFSDINEFAKFAKDKKLRGIKVPFAKLPEAMLKSAQSCTFNPMSINLILSREQISKIIG